jgi:hypothetical protein
VDNETQNNVWLQEAEQYNRECPWEKREIGDGSNNEGYYVQEWDFYPNNIVEEYT